MEEANRLRASKKPIKECRRNGGKKVPEGDHGIANDEENGIKVDSGIRR